MLKVIGISAVTLLCTLLLRERSRGFSILVSITGICILTAIVAGELSEIIVKITTLSDSFNSGIAYIKTMLKVLGITLSAQIVSDICRDNGENALASATELTAKIMIIALMLPLFETLISIINGLIK